MKQMNVQKYKLNFFRFLDKKIFNSDLKKQNTVKNNKIDDIFNENTPIYT